MSTEIFGVLFYFVYYNRYLGQVSCHYLEWLLVNIQFKWRTQVIKMKKIQNEVKLKMVSKSNVPTLGGRWGFLCKVIWLGTFPEYFSWLRTFLRFWLFFVQISWTITFLATVPPEWDTKGDFPLHNFKRNAKKFRTNKYFFARNFFVLLIST